MLRFGRGLTNQPWATLGIGKRVGEGGGMQEREKKVCCNYASRHVHHQPRGRLSYLRDLNLKLNISLWH